jgi:hypothetical protein
MKALSRSNWKRVVWSAVALASIYLVMREVDRRNNHWAGLDFNTAEQLVKDDLDRGFITIFSEKESQISTLNLGELSVRLVPFAPTKESNFFFGLEKSPPCFATHSTALLVRRIFQPQTSANPLIRKHSSALIDLLFAHQPSARIQINKQALPLSVLKPIFEENIESVAKAHARRSWISY